MGYNATIHISNQMLPEISSNKDFGPMLADMISAYHDADAKPVKGLRISGYSHADQDQVHLVRNGQIAMVTSTEPENIGYLRELLASNGGLTPDPETGAISDRKGWNLDYNDEILETASTTLIVLGDATPDFRDDTDLGARLADGITEHWKLMRSLESIEGRVRPVKGLMDEMRARLRTDIRSGNHVNPISVAAITPFGRDDAIIVGQNRARAIRPYAPAFVDLPDGQNKDHLKRLHQQDLDILQRAVTDIFPVLQCGDFQD